MSSVSWDIILGAVGAAGSIGLAFAVLLFTYDRRRQMRYDREHNRIELELLRRATESKMYELSERLLANEARWRDANHLLISSQDLQPTSISAAQPMLTPFLQAAGIRTSDIDGDPDLVFVLTPFHPDFRETFQTISDVCRSLNVRALRGDEEFTQGDVFSHILKLIVRARLIIANVDGRNPNVLYELGLAHALGKTTILVSKSPEDVPFDVRAKRLVLFRDQDDLKDSLKSELARALFSQR